MRAPPVPSRRVLSSSPHPLLIDSAECALLLDNVTVDCAEGYCAVGGQANCSLCTPGTFQSGFHRLGCPPCQLGTFTKGWGCFVTSSPRLASAHILYRSSECNLCSRGFFCNQTRLVAPFPCPAGYCCPDLGTIVPLLCPPVRRIGSQNLISLGILLSHRGPYLRYSM